VSRARALSLVLVAGLLGGCVYYNGMYNAKRLAGSARKAERDGRTFEANNLWGQVITRAESLVARHPDSKYVDEALVLKGVALARLRQCRAAVTPLARVPLLPADAEVSEEGALALGRCRLELGDPEAADAMLARVAESEDPVRRGEARLLRARTLRMTSRHEAAVALLDGVPGRRAMNERLLALAGARRSDAALALADTLLATSDTSTRWDTVAVAVGREDAATASALVDRLEKRPGTAPDARARLLLDDALRMAALDTARAEARLRQAASIEEAGPSTAQARLRLTRLRLSRVTVPSDLPPLATELAAQVSAKTVISAEAGQLRETVTRILAAGDSAAAGAAQSDLRLFLAAESARDSLAAPVLAASLFRRLVEGTPESPYVPKAILAGAALDSVWGASVVPLLEMQYASSPYVAFLQGAEPYGYRELEDSLRSFAIGAAAARRNRGRARPPLSRD
jgi:hypothetical protein